MIQFDFVSFFLPPKSARPLSNEEFIQLCEAVENRCCCAGRSWSELPVIPVTAASSDTSNHCIKLCADDVVRLRVSAKYPLLQ